MQPINAKLQFNRQRSDSHVAFIHDRAFFVESPFRADNLGQSDSCEPNEERRRVLLNRFDTKAEVYKYVDLAALFWHDDALREFLRIENSWKGNKRKEISAQFAIGLEAFESLGYLISKHN